MSEPWLLHLAFQEHQYSPQDWHPDATADSKSTDGQPPDHSQLSPDTWRLPCHLPRPLTHEEHWKPTGCSGTWQAPNLWWSQGETKQQKKAEEQRPVPTAADCLSKQEWSEEKAEETEAKHCLKWWVWKWILILFYWHEDKYTYDYIETNIAKVDSIYRDLLIILW